MTALLIFWVLYGIAVDAIFKKHYENASFKVKMVHFIVTLLHGPIGPYLYLYRSTRRLTRDLENGINVMEEAVQLTEEQAKQINGIIEKYKKENDGKLDSTK